MSPPLRALDADRTPVLTANGLTVHYGQRCAVRAVDLVVESPGVLALIGPSGTGKSTVLLALNRLLDLVPGARVEGEVALACCNIRAPGVRVAEVRRRVGMVFQQPNPFPMSIERNIGFALREHGLRDRRARRDRVEEVLHAVGLWAEVHDRLDRSALTLSGGQQQRLCIARAIALDPEVLLLDEPTSSLDPAAQRRVEQLIAELGARYAIVLVTHDLHQARRLATDVAAILPVDGAGELVEQGAVDEIFERARDARVARYVGGGLL